jgi:hypothetical protein
VNSAEKAYPSNPPEESEPNHRCPPEGRLSALQMIKGLNDQLIKFPAFPKKEIAQQLGIPRSLLDHATQRIYKRHGLGPKAGKQALAKKLGVELPGRAALAHEFRQRLLAGQSNQEIADTLGLTLLKVQKRCANLYRREGVRGRKGLFEKYPNLLACASPPQVEH